MLGIDPSVIDIVHGDTSKIPFGMGTYGSRSLAVCGSAIVRATEKDHRQSQPNRGTYVGDRAIQSWISQMAIQRRRVRTDPSALAKWLESLHPA